MNKEDMDYIRDGNVAQPNLKVRATL